MELLSLTILILDKLRYMSSFDYQIKLNLIRNQQQMSITQSAEHNRLRQDLKVQQKRVESQGQSKSRQKVLTFSKRFRSFLYQNLSIIQVQTLWKLIFISIIVISVILVKKLYIFHTHEHFANVQKGLLSDILMYSIPFGVLFTIFDFVIHRIFDPIFQKHYITEERYKEPQSKKKRCYTLVKWAYSIIYYLISSIWAYKIISNTTFLPTWLGGLGTQLYPLTQSLGVPEATFEMKFFYILQAGKHLSRFFSHVFIRPEGAFFEYALHHGLSCFLILFSYFSNQWLIGIFVLLVHDYSDFALILARTYKDYKNFSKTFLDLIYIHGFTAWVSCRILLFSYYCIYGSLHQLHKIYVMDQQTIQTMEFMYYFMIGMMIALEILHLYWTYYIAQSFVAIKISSKLARHSYD